VFPQYHKWKSGQGKLIRDEIIDKFLDFISKEGLHLIIYRVQTELKSKLIETDDLKFTKTIKEENGEQIVEFDELSYIGGVDLSFENNEENAIASLIVLKYPSLEVCLYL
jgi:hypothetical protein